MQCTEYSYLTLCKGKCANINCQKSRSLSLLDILILFNLLVMGARFSNGLVYILVQNIRGVVGAILFHYLFASIAKVPTRIGIGWKLHSGGKRHVLSMMFTSHCIGLASLEALDVQRGCQRQGVV